MDAFLSFVENTDLSMWIWGDSMLAFPTIITLHTIGMGFLAGTSTAIDLRILGFASGVPLKVMGRLFPMMLLALTINVATGILLVIGYPTKQLTNPIFYTKLALLSLALYLLARIGTELFRLPDPDEKRLSGRTRTLASASIAAWVALIVAGRLLEYTQKWELFGVRAVH